MSFTISQFAIFSGEKGENNCFKKRKSNIFIVNYY